jgi:UDP-N-acetyl-D-mannosaminuronate dehydrogenase
VDDLRESPAVKLARHLQASGGRVYAYEPFKPNADIPGITQVDELETALQEADLLVLAVAHEQFIKLDPQQVRGQTRANLVFDSVRGWDKSAWERAGFQFFGLARKH